MFVDVFLHGPLQECPALFLQLGSLECVVAVSSLIRDVNHRIVLPVQDEVHDESGDSSVAVAKRVYCHKLLVRKSRKLDWMQLILVFVLLTSYSLRYHQNDGFQTSSKIF